MSARVLSPLFPSDLPRADEGDFQLAGRIVAQDEQAIWVADAFSTARIGVRGMTNGTAIGDLVVLLVHGHDEGLEVRSVVFRHRPTATAGDAEQARFLRGGVGTRLRSRALALQEARAFFVRRGFVEVDTPLLVPSPGLDLHLDAIEAEGGWLMTSPEYQMKRLLVGGVPRLFQIAHVFRQGEVGERHNPEFSLLEWYRAFAVVGDVMRDTEQLVFELASALAGGPELAGPKGAIDTRPPYERISMAEAFARHAGITTDQFFSLAANDEDAFFRILVDQVEPALATYPRPVFLVDYPISQASLARPKPSDPRVCERFELYAGGIELCNGFGELTDPIEQRRRLLADQELRRMAHKKVYPIDERFLAALDEGMPPSAGNALGLDRLVALCLGERSISQVIPFPAGTI